MTLRTLCASVALAACALATTPAHALHVPEGTQITATASSGSLFSAADGYAATANPATAALGGNFGDVEFLTDDFNLFFDFLSDGTLQIYGLAQGLSNSFEFSFADLPGLLTGFAPLQPVQGLSFEVLDGHTLRLTLDDAAFPDDGSPISASITVPEPGLPALLAAALAALALRRRAGR